MMIGFCHCTNCQKQSGSAFLTLAAFQKTDIAFTGNLSLYEDGDADTGNTVSRYFCGTCGSPIYSAIPSQPDMAYLKTDTMDDTDGFVAMFHCWSSTKQDWV